MKSLSIRNAVVILMCGFINSYSFASLASMPNSVKIISMNMHCFDDDWQFRFNHILNKFLEISPEVIAMQEVCADPQTGQNQIDFIKDYLLHRGYSIQAITAQFTHLAWGKYEEYIVLISKLKASTVDQGLLPASLLQRGFIAFNINQVWYINTHLEYKAENAQSRKSQIDFLMQRFARTPHLIIGDFNSSPGTPEQANLKANAYVDLFPGDSHLGDDGNASKRIDGAWISPQLANKIQHLNAWIILNEKVQNRYLSDHFAVFAQFGFKAN